MSICADPTTARTFYCEGKFFASVLAFSENTSYRIILKKSIKYSLKHTNTVKRAKTLS